MVGPSIGGWLYEIGGIRAAVPARRRARCAGAVGFSGSTCRRPRADRSGVAAWSVLRIAAPSPSAPPVVVAIAATTAMLEPVLPLFLTAKLGLGPARIGLIFGCGAVASTMLHPIYGRLADRWGGRRMMLTGLPLVACIAAAAQPDLELSSRRSPSSC